MQRLLVILTGCSYSEHTTTTSSGRFCNFAVNGRKLVTTSNLKRARLGLALSSKRRRRLNESDNLDQTTRLMGISLLSCEGTPLVARPHVGRNLVNQLIDVLNSPSSANQSLLSKSEFTRAIRDQVRIIFNRRRLLEGVST